MKTREIKIPKMSLLVLIPTILIMLTACAQPCDDCGPIRTATSIQSFTAGPEGGTFKALDGNVTLNIPKSALDEQVKIVVIKGPTDYDGDFVIKSIEISPDNILFNKPVGLSIKYNGQLNCGQDPCSARCLVTYRFKNDKDFDKRNYSDMIWISKCHLNRMDCCIETEIQSGGIYAIGEESLGQPAIFQP